MRYIRTKDGIYVLSEAYWAGNTDEIIAEADTIEELCDEFVVFDEMNKCCMEIVGSYSSIENNGWIGSAFEIYGAIWTDKGLIYVAKMNEKGELELI